MEVRLRESKMFGIMQLTNFCALNPQISRMNADFLDFYPRNPRHLRIKQMPCL